MEKFNYVFFLVEIQFNYVKHDQGHSKIETTVFSYLFIQWYVALFSLFVDFNIIVATPLSLYVNIFDTMLKLLAFISINKCCDI